MTRTKSLRTEIGWSQSALAIYLNMHQRAVWRLEQGGDEPGAISRLLDALAHGLSSGLVRAGMSPGEALSALGFEMAAVSPAGTENLSDCA